MNIQKLLQYLRRFGKKSTAPQAKPSDSVTDTAEAPAAQLVGVGAKRGGKVIFSEVQMLLPAGRLLAVGGKKGSGKSVLLEIIAGVRLCREGRVTIFGQEAKRPGAKLRQKISLVPSRLALRPGLPLGRFFLHQGALCGINRGETEKRTKLLAERFGILPRLDLTPDLLRPIDIALAGLTAGLLRAPKMICVDDPVVPLNRSDRRLFWDEMGLLRDEGITVVASSRNLGEPWRVADEVLLLQDGIARYPGADELARLENLSGMLEVRLETSPRIIPPELAAFRPEFKGRTMRIHSSDPMGHLVDVIEALLTAGLRVEDLGILDSEALEDVLRQMPEKESGGEKP